MSAENHPYNGATFEGECYVFPDMLLTMNPELAAPGHAGNQADHYKVSSNQDRSFKQYNEAFGFDLGVFEGCRVLDLGAGMFDRFGSEATKRGLDVISINPLWKNEIDSEIPQPKVPFNGNGHSISAVAQKLPLRCDSIDAVISLWGVPAYLPGTKGEYGKAFGEIRRVLAPGGVALLYPVPVVTAMQPAFKEVLNESFGNSWRLADQRGIPKLFYAKEGGDDALSEFNDYLFSCMDQPTNAFIL